MLSVKNFEMLDYNIRISGNKNGKHDYVFNVDGKFFERFVGHDIKKAQIDIIATLWKNNDKLKLSLKINGFSIFIKIYITPFYISIFYVY